MIRPMPSFCCRAVAAFTALCLLAAPAWGQAGDSSWEDAPATAEEVPAEKAQLAGPGAPAEYSDADPSALTDFSADLEPYGYWRDDPTYGRVWVPHQHVVGADFAPYVTSGHWAVADDGGWLWVSDYPFGWVVFHYGRWVWVGGTGWAWIPGRRYAHAWVVWRVPAPGWTYVGWAPMPPEYVWYDGVAVGVWFGLYTPWVFCHSHYIYHPHVHHYVVHDHHHAHEIAAHSHRYYPPAGAAPYSGPTAKAAHIPAKAVPRKHTPADPKAMGAARPKSPPTPAKILRPGGHPSRGSGTRTVRPTPPRGTPGFSGRSEQPLRSSRPPAVSGPSRPAPPPGTYRAPGPGPSRAAPPSGPAPRASAPSGPAPRALPPARPSAPRYAPAPSVPPPPARPMPPRSRGPRRR